MHAHFAGHIGLPSLPDGITVTQGEEPPIETTHLVNGSPKEEWLNLPNLQAVIVPWAGVSDSLASQIKQRPHLSLYNLHVNAYSVAELAIGLLLSVARGIPAGDRGMREGVWKIPEEANPNIKLRGRTACLVGYGGIGQALNPILRAMGMQTLKVRLHPDPADPTQHPVSSLVEATTQSHVLILSMPLNKETRGVIDRTVLESLLPPRIVINVGRGPLIVEEDLYNFLKEGIGTGGFDVWHSYPPDRRGEPVAHFPSQFPIHTLPNVVMSPHRGGWTVEAEPDRSEGVAKILTDLYQGLPVKPVDPDVG